MDTAAFSLVRFVIWLLSVPIFTDPPMYSVSLQLHSEMSAEPPSNMDVLSNLQAQVQNKPYETTVRSDDDYHSTPITRRKQVRLLAGCCS